MAAKCYVEDCQNSITHLRDHVAGYFCCEPHAVTYSHDKRAVVLYLPINGLVLTIRRANLEKGETDHGFVEQGDYCLPGGKVEEGETDWEAIVRETYEETGLDIADPTPLFCHESFADTGRLVTAFTARLVSSPFEIKGNGREGTPEWNSPNVLLQSHCTYREYNDALLAKLGVQL
jgi:8-oxo-dGTP pyrophosphatase MutT (NUDIX family)